MTGTAEFWLLSMMMSDQTDLTLSGRTFVSRTELICKNLDLILQIKESSFDPARHALEEWSIFNRDVGASFAELFPENCLVMKSLHS